MKRKSVYDTMTTSDLARITRERGLEKPAVHTRSEWADFLEADDAKAARPPAPSSEEEGGAETPTDETEQGDTPASPPKSIKKKGS